MKENFYKKSSASWLGKMSLMVIAILFAGVVNAATNTWYWVGGTSGTSFTTLSNWNSTKGGGGTTPTAFTGTGSTVIQTNDILIFDGSNLGGGVTTGGTINISTFAATTIGELDVVNTSNSGATKVNLPNTGTFVLTIGATGNTGNLVISLGNTLDLGAAVTIATAGTFNPTVNGTLKCGNGGSAPPCVPLNIDWTANGATGTVVFNQPNPNGNQRITPGTYYNLDGDGGTGFQKNFGNTTGQSFTIKGNFYYTANSTAGVQTSVFTFSGTNQVIPPATYYSIVISGTGTTTVGTTNSVGNNVSTLTLNAAGTLTINSGSTLDLGDYTLSATAANVTNSGKIRTSSFTALPAVTSWGGEVEYYGAGSQTIPASTFTNLTISGTRAATASATGTWAAGSKIITNLSTTSGFIGLTSGTITGPAGIGTTSGATTNTISSVTRGTQIKGYYSNANSPSTDTRIGVVAAATTYLPVGMTLSGTDIPSGTTITAVTAAPAQLTSSATVGAAWTSASKTITLTSTSTLAVGMYVTYCGNFTIPVGAIVTSIVNSTSITISQFPTGSNAASTTLSFSAVITISNSVTAVGTGATVNCSGIITMGSAATTAQSSAQSVSVPTTLTLTNSATTNVNGVLKVNYSGSIGSFSVTSNTLNLNTTSPINGLLTSQILSPFTVNSLTVGAADTLTVGAALTNGTTTINGSLKDSLVGSLSNAPTFSAGSTLILNPTSTYTVSSSDKFWPSGSLPTNVYALTALNMNSQARTVSGTLLVGAAVTSAGSITETGTIQMYPGGSLDVSPATGSSYHLAYSNTGGSFSTGGEWNTSYVKNITINSSTSVTAGSDVTLNSNGTWTNSGTFTPSTFGVTFSGTGGTSITGATTFNNLTNSNSGGLTLNDNVTVSNVLTLGGGVIATGSKTLSITNPLNTAVAAGSAFSATNYINGSLSWKLPTSSSSTFTFPIGTSSGSVNYYPISINSPTSTATTTVTAGVVYGSTGGSADGSTLTGISSSEYWSLAAAGGNLTGGTISLTRTGQSIGSSNVIGQSSTLASSYASFGGTVSGTSINTSNAISITANSSKYYVYGIKFTSNPTISTVSGGKDATSGYVGQTVTINGSGYQSGATVSFDGGSNFVSAGFTDANNLTVTLPSSINSIIVKSGGVNTSAYSYSINGYISIGTGDWNSTTPGSPWPSGLVPGAGSTVTINSAVTVGASVSGTISSINITSGSLAINAGGSLTSTSITNGATLSTASTGALTVTTLNNNSTIDMTSGGTINIAGNFAQSATFTAGTGTVVFNGTTTMTQTAPTTFKGLSITGTFTSPASTINIAGNFSNSGTFNANGGTVVFTGTTTMTQSSTTTFNHLTITGTFTAPASEIDVTGTWTNNGTASIGTGGTVKLTGGDQKIDGNTTFYNLTKSVSSPYTLTITNGTTQIVSNTLTLSGASGGNLLTVVGSLSTVANININPSIAASSSISYCNLSYIKNINSTAFSATNTVNGVSLTNINTSITWVGTTSGNWSTASNWGTNTIPSATDNVLFDNSVTANTSPTVTLSGSPSSIVVTTVAGVTVSNSTLTISSGSSANKSALTTTSLTLSSGIIQSDTYQASLNINSSLTFNGTGSKVYNNTSTNGTTFTIGNGGAFTLTGCSKDNYFDGSSSAYYTFNTTNTNTSSSGNPMTVYFNPTTTTTLGNLIVNAGSVVLGNSVSTNRVGLAATNASYRPILILGSPASGTNVFTMTGNGTNYYTNASNGGYIDATASNTKVAITSTSTSGGLNTFGTIFKTTTGSIINELEMNSTGYTFYLPQAITVKTLTLTAGAIANTVNNITIADGGTINKAAGVLLNRPVFAGQANITTSGTSIASNELQGTGSTAIDLTVNNGNTYTLNASSLYFTTTTGFGYATAPTITVGTAWQTGITYNLNDFVTSGTKVYMVTTAGTSKGSAPTTTGSTTVASTGAVFTYVTTINANVTTIASSNVSNVSSGYLNVSFTDVGSGFSGITAPVINVPAPVYSTFSSSSSYLVNAVVSTGTNLYYCSTGPTVAGTNAVTTPSGTGTTTADAAGYKWTYLGLVSSVTQATATAYVPAKNALSLNSVTILGTGVLTYPDQGTALSVSVTGKVGITTNSISIASGASFKAGTQSSISHKLNVAFDIANSGTIDFTGSGSSKAVDVTFNGTVSQSLSGGTNKFNALNIGTTSPSTTPTVTIPTLSASSVTVTTGSTLALGGTLTSTSIAVNGGTLQMNDNANVSSAPVYSNTSSLVYNATLTNALEWGTGADINTAGVPQDVTINLGKTVTLGNATVGGNLTINGTLKLNANLQVNGNWNNAGTFTPSSNTVTFGSNTSASTITNVGGEIFDGLTINNSKGVSLKSPVIVNKVLTLTNGNITTTASSLLTLSAAAATAGGSDNSYIDGPMAYTLGSSSSSYNFPVGDLQSTNTTYLPFVLSPTSTSGTVTVQAFGTAKYGFDNSKFKSVGKAYWSVFGSTSIDAAATLASSDVLSNSVVALSTGSTYSTNLGGDSYNSISSPNSISTITNLTIGTSPSYLTVGAVNGAISLDNTIVSSGYFGQTITLTGSGLLGASVTINGQAASSTGSNTDGSLQVIVPITTVNSVASPGTIRVKNATSQVSKNFVVAGYGTQNDNDWSIGSTWYGGNVPPANATVTVNNNITVYGSVNSPDNVTVSAGKSITFANTGALTVNTLLTNAGIINMTLSNNATLTIKGTASNTGVGSLNFTAGSVVFAGATAQTIPAATYNNLAVTNTTGVSAGGNLTVNGQLNIANTATLDMGSFTLSGSTLTTSGTGTLKTASTATTPIPAIVPAWSFGVNYYSGTQNVVNNSYSNLTVSGTTGKFGTSVNVANDFNYTATSAPTVTGNTISFNGTTTQNINTNSVFTFNGLTVSNTKASVLAGADLTITTLTINDGAVLDMQTKQLLGATLTTVGGSNGTGILKTGHLGTSATTAQAPIPTGRTWNFLVEFTSLNGGQTIPTAGTTTGFTTFNKGLKCDVNTSASSSNMDSVVNTTSATTAGMIVINGQLTVGVVRNSDGTINSAGTFSLGNQVLNSSSFDASAFYGNFRTNIANSGVSGVSYIYPSGTTWGTGSTVYYDFNANTANNRIVPGTYYNLVPDYGQAGSYINLDLTSNTTSTASFIINGSLTPRFGRLSYDGSFANRYTTVSFNGTNQTIPANWSFYNLKLGTTSKLPVGDTIIVYGSLDAGKTTSLDGTVIINPAAGLSDLNFTVPALNYGNLIIKGNTLSNKSGYTVSGSAAIAMDNVIDSSQTVGVGIKGTNIPSNAIISTVSYSPFYPTSGSMSSINYTVIGSKYYFSYPSTTSAVTDFNNTSGSMAVYKDGNYTGVYVSGVTKPQTGLACTAISTTQFTYTSTSSSSVLSAGMLVSRNVSDASGIAISTGAYISAVSAASGTGSYTYTVTLLPAASITGTGSVTLDFGAVNTLSGAITGYTTGTAYNTMKFGPAIVLSATATGSGYISNISSFNNSITYSSGINVSGNFSDTHLGTFATTTVNGAVNLTGTTSTLTLSTTDFKGKINIPSSSTVTASASATIASGGIITNAGNLNISSNLTNNGVISGAGTTKINGTAAQSISGSGSISNLTIDNSGNTATISSGSNLSITGVLYAKSGTLDMGTNGLTLKSTSITNTAIVDQVTGIIKGTATVERYIPAGFRAYRDIAPEVYKSTNTIFNTWQEGGTMTSGTGIFITGPSATHADDGFYGANAASAQPSSASSGLDYSINGAASAYTYNNAAGTFNWNYGGTTNTYSTGAIPYGIANTSTTTLDPLTGFRILVRGDRSFNLAKTPISNIYNYGLLMVKPTTLRATGQLIAKDVVYNKDGATATAADGSTAISSPSVALNTTFGARSGFSMVANPYVAPVQWTKVYAASVAVSAGGINASYWYLDPTYSATGTYLAYNALSGGSSVTSDATNSYTKASTNATTATDFIQPGQAFFVQSASATPTVKFTEACKAASSANLKSIFGVTAPVSKIYLSLLMKDTANKYAGVDGAALAFRSDFGNTSYGPQDALKFGTSNNSVAISDKGTALSIDGRMPATASDVIPIALRKLTAKSYKLVIDASSYNANSYLPVLKDNYRGIVKVLSIGVDTITFTVDTSIAATYSNRFSLGFKQTTLSVNSIVASASLNNKTASISWNTVGEKRVSRFEVEKSTDAKSFTKIGQATAKNTSTASYSATDNNATAATNYYRIKAISEVGTVSYSNVVKVSISNYESGITLYPNPLKGSKVLNVSLANVSAGKYSVTITNVLGQKVHEAAISHQGGTATHAITVTNTLAAGTYSVTVRDANCQAVYQSNLSVQP